ncbi:MAG TPA: C4-type zinc ribbon domain-containing protein [Acidimicrobiales bacterium]|nr:C4-type zinc ribbon domain-containing protein [Acidimicrobiales bacterium]
MTELYDRLLALQARDLAIDQLRHRARNLPEREELRKLGARRSEREAVLRELSARLDGLNARQRTLDDQVAAVTARRHELEARMRAASGYSIRDLQAMDHEINQLAAHQTGLEERELALLEEAEPLESEAETLRADVERLQAETARLEAAVAEQETAIDAEVEADQAARAELASGIPAELLDHYEAVRARRDGIGAAALVGDRCGGCHLTLPAVDLDRIRHLPAEELVVCPECDRILVR